MLDEKTLLELQEYVYGRLERPTLFNCYELGDIVDRYAAGGEFDTYGKGSRPTFREVLYSYIRKKGVVDADIFHEAGIDPKDFSRAEDPLYKPDKKTALALAIALGLNKIETDRLLGAAGYAFSNSDTFDLVIQFCLGRGIHSRDKVNQALHIFGLEPLLRV